MESGVSVIHVVLIVFAASAGLTRLAIPYEKFIRLPAQGWASEFRPAQVKLIGVVEVAAALGLALPLVVPSLSLLTPLAAFGIALVMAGAMATHMRRSEYPNMAGNLVWLGVALFVAYSNLPGSAV